MKELNIKYLYIKNYLHVIVEGKDTLEHSIRYWIDIIEEARIKNVNRILVEERLVGTLGKSDVYRLNKEILKQDIKHIKKIAFFDSEIDHSYDNSFGTTMLLKEGINIMLFDSFEEALAWIEH